MVQVLKKHHECFIMNICGSHTGQSIEGDIIRCLLLSSNNLLSFAEVSDPKKKREKGK